MAENRVIETEEELDTLPFGTIVMDQEGSPYQHHDDVPNWYNIFGGEEWPHEVMLLGPVTVLHQPEPPKPVLPTTAGSVVRSNVPGDMGQAHVILTHLGKWYGASHSPVNPEVWLDGWTVVHDAGAER
jgi:hypothetical protein